MPRVLLSAAVWIAAILVTPNASPQRSVRTSGKPGQTTSKPKANPARTGAQAANARAASRTNSVVDAWMKSMTLRDKIAQLVIAPCFGENNHVRTADYQRLERWVKELKVGGLIVVNRVQYGSVRNAEPYQMAAFLNRMQRLADIPLIVGGDFERGASMRVAGTTLYPHNMAYGASRDPLLSRQAGLATARESRALGIHWVFAPVADVNNNPDNPVINIRSYSEKAEDVAAHVTAYIEGAHSDPANPVLVTVKHFPGHGDTATDSHLGLAKITADRARLDAVELVPFRAAIKAGVDSVMTAHLSVPALEAQEIPATVSKAILTELLRKELGFEGIVVTDAMDMLGLSRMFSINEASVRALEAGSDVLLMPSRPEAAISGVLRAIEMGRLSEARIDESVRKLLAAKVRLGLNRNKLVDLEHLNEVIDSPEAAALAQNISDRAVTLVRNDKDIFPVSEPANSCLFILAENRQSRQGLRLLDEVRGRAPGMKAQILDASLPEVAFQEFAEMRSGCKTAYVAAFVSVSSYRGDLALAGGFTGFVQKLLAGPTPVGLISLGNPYLLKSFPNAPAFLTTYSTTPMAEVSAVKAIFGEIKLTGRLPVTVPSVAEYGQGIQLPARSGRVSGRISGSSR